MIKVRILDQCESCDGAVSMREARCFTATDLEKCAMGVVIGRRGKSARVR